MKKTILYLRTDICDELTAGGSVAHTTGVIKGFLDLGYPVVCATSCLNAVLKPLPLTAQIPLSNPRWLQFLRWKVNCLLSSFFFFFQAKELFKQYPITAIYQRYSPLNATGLLLSWWYKKPFILEYNGSEAWAADHWAQKKRFISGTSLLYAFERTLLRSANTLVVVSEVLREEVLSYGVKNERILVNPNGVDTELFNPKKVSYEQRANNSDKRSDQARVGHQSCWMDPCPERRKRVS